MVSTVFSLVTVTGVVTALKNDIKNVKGFLQHLLNVLG